MSTQDRRPLNRARVIERAVQLADADGIDAVSMRSLAGELGVVPMALYKHVSDRDDLRAGMIDAVVAGYAPPELDSDWRTRVHQRVGAARAEILRHSWLRGAIETAHSPSLIVLTHMNAVAGDLFAAGFSADLVHHAMHVLGSRIWGFSPESFPGPAMPADAAHEALAAAAAAFPYVLAIAQAAALSNPSGACDPDEEFTFTIDLMLDAFERLHEAGWMPGKGGSGTSAGARSKHRQKPDDV